MSAAEARNRVAILTGAYGGIGGGILTHLLAAGYNVLGVDRVAPSALSGPHEQSVVADITDPETPDRLVAEAVDAFGGLDVIVNCAGVLRDSRIEQMPAADMRFVLDVNLFAAMRIVAAAIPALRQSGTGRIVSISSRGVLGVFGSSNYSASKGGLVGMTRALALAEGGAGITANTIAPGFVATALSAHLSGSNAVEIPVGRAGTVDDIGRAVTFLASPDAGYITGQTLNVCGGRSIQP